MSAVLEPNQAILMGRERYSANARNRISITAYVSDTTDRIQWKICFEQLRRLGSYEFDWNDEGAEPPRTDVLSLSNSIAKVMRANSEPAPTRCFATDEGHIIFAWEDGACYLELEIDIDLCCTARWLQPGAKLAESAVINMFTSGS